MVAETPWPKGNNTRLKPKEEEERISKPPRGEEEEESVEEEERRKKKNFFPSAESVSLTILIPFPF